MIFFLTPFQNIKLQLPVELNNNFSNGITEIQSATRVDFVSMYDFAGVICVL